MKNFISIFVFSIFFLLLQSCYQDKTSYKDKLACIQIIDRNGLSETISSKERLEQYQKSDFFNSQPYKQVLRIFKKDPHSGKTRAILTSYHANSKMSQYLEIVDSRACGQYKEFYSSGQLKVDAFIIGGAGDFSFTSQKDWLFHGFCKAYDENGNIISLISYNNGLLEGESIYYYCTGQIKQKIPYSNGEINGDIEEFFENHDKATSSKTTDIAKEVPTIKEMVKIAKKTHFENGIKNGLSVGFHENEKRQFEEFYNNDLLEDGSYFDKENEKIISSIKNGNGKKSTFYEDGDFYQFIEFSQGKEDGEIEQFSKNTKELEKKWYVKNGQKQGEEIIYYLKDEIFQNQKKTDQNFLLPKIVITWDDNTIHGCAKSYYNTGALESQREFSRNKKNGPSSAWYKDGSLMFIEEYEEDLLISAKYYKKKDKTEISTIKKGDGVATLFTGDGIFLKKITYKNGKCVE